MLVVVLLVAVALLLRLPLVLVLRVVLGKGGGWGRADDAGGRDGRGTGDAYCRVGGRGCDDRSSRCGRGRSRNRC